MKPCQNYISNELTHFVGRALADAEAQYGLPLKILHDGKLMCKHGAGLLIDPFADFSTNNMFRAGGVCFCDIPQNESLAIHMKKYSSFGLSFSKSFLVERGANPVFYIVTNAQLKSLQNQEQRGRHEEIANPESRTQHLNKQFSEFYGCMRETKLLFHNSRELISEAGATIDRLEGVEQFIGDLAGYFKCFDASKPEDDEDNFYMEREWRLRRHLFFKGEDVQRVILPKSFLPRFRTDCQSFSGAEEKINEEVVSIQKEVSTT